jgi:hypothetical protein
MCALMPIPMTLRYSINDYSTTLFFSSSSIIILRYIFFCIHFHITHSSIEQQLVFKGRSISQ